MHFCCDLKRAFQMRINPGVRPHIVMQSLWCPTLILMHQQLNVYQNHFIFYLHHFLFTEVDTAMGFDMAVHGEPADAMGVIVNDLAMHFHTNFHGGIADCAIIKAMIQPAGFPDSAYIRIQYISCPSLQNASSRCN